MADKEGYAGNAGKDRADNADQRTPEGIHVVTLAETRRTCDAFMQNYMLRGIPGLQQQNVALVEKMLRNNVDLAMHCTERCSSTAKDFRDEWETGPRSVLQVLLENCCMTCPYSLLYKNDGGVPPRVEPDVIRGVELTVGNQDERNRLVASLRETQPALAAFGDAVRKWLMADNRRLAYVMMVRMAENYEIVRRQAAADTYALGQKINFS